MHITLYFLQVYLLEACVFPLLYLVYITFVIFISYARVGCVAYCTECIVGNSRVYKIHRVTVYFCIRI